MRFLRSAGRAGAVSASLLALILSSSACSTENTCFPGSATTNPRIAGKAQPSLQGSKIRIVWDVGTERGAELPRSYFAAATVDTASRAVGPDGPSVEEKVEVTTDRELVVTVRGTTAELQGKLRFDVVFPDRKKFITCERADGVVDHYGLAVSAELDGQGTITKSTVTEVRNTSE